MPQGSIPISVVTQFSGISDAIFLGLTNSVPALLHCLAGGGLAPMRFCNFSVAKIMPPYDY